MFLIELLSEIPECVKKQLKHNNIKIWYAKPYMYIRLTIGLTLIALKSWFPYKRALIRIAYDKYKETVMYRERLIHFGEAFALRSFIDNREDKLFVTHITKKEKIKAFFLPFNYIARI